jgi:hypothetical protein
MQFKVKSFFFFILRVSSWGFVASKSLIRKFNFSVEQFFSIVHLLIIEIWNINRENNRKLFSYKNLSVRLASYLFSGEIPLESLLIFLKMISIRFLIIMAVVSMCRSFSIKQLKDGEKKAAECIFEVGINPLSVNRLRKGDFSKVDEKSRVS